MKSRSRSRPVSAPHSVARLARNRTSPGPSTVQPKRAQGPSHEHGELDPQERIERATRLGHSFTRVGVGADLAAPSGRGSGLPDPVRTKMESAFGADFSDVRVHQTPDARSIGAVAFTRGRDIHFTPGRYDPASLSGQKLIGHEMTHVVQQRAGHVAVPQGPGLPVNADPTLEAEADHLGAKAARGEPARAPWSGLAVNRVSRPAGVAPIQGFKWRRRSNRSSGRGQHQRLLEENEDEASVPNAARRSERKSGVATAASISASATNTGLQAGAIITQGASTAIGVPLSIISTGRSARQAGRAGRRAIRAGKVARANTTNERTRLLDRQGPQDPRDEELAKIATYTKRKQKRRAKRLGVQATLSATSAGAGVAALAAGVVTPPAIAAEAVGLGAVVLGAGQTAAFAAKGIYKKIRGTKGKARRENATHLLNLASSGHEPSKAFLEDLGVLDRGQGSGKFTEQHLASENEKDREKMTQYVMQKMRS